MNISNKFLPKKIAILFFLSFIYSLHAQDTIFKIPTKYYYKFSAGLGVGSDGLIWGGDFTISKQIKNWKLFAGFGIGSNYVAAGGFISYKRSGVGYYTACFGDAVGPDEQSNKQIVGGVMVFCREFSFRFENDFFFMGDKYDRWRTTAFEIGIKKFVIGAFIYTNMPDKNNANYNYDQNYKGSIWKGNRKAYSDGKVYRSVFYVGYRFGNLIIRIGVNHPVIQDILQNGWHIMVNKPFFYTPYGQYFSPYIYIGYYNPFSLYGK